MHSIGIARTRLSTRLARQHLRGNVSVRAEVKVTGEYNESDGKVSIPDAQKKDAKQNADGTYYIDELEDMKRKLRKKYVELGGSANTPMANNYFLYIIVAISGLAISCKILGYI